MPVHSTWSPLLLAASVIVILAVVRMSARPPGDEAREAVASLEQRYRDLVRENKIVGSTLMMVRDGDVILNAVHGVQGVDTKRPVDEDTIFHWASITKTFTGIAIMQLRDRGRLALDDPIVKYVPELHAVHNPFGDVGAITIRQLMSHSAGFRNPTWPWGGDKAWHPHEPQHWSQLVAMFPYTEVEFVPGSKYSYSNPGIVFLGRAIELLTMDDYEVYIDKNILKPLQMHRTYFDNAPYHLLPHLSSSYYAKAGALTRARFDVNTGITVSNGGLNAPLGDMLKYLRFLLGDPTQQATYDGVLKRSSLEEMFEPRLPVESIGGVKKSIGLTFFVDEAPGGRVIHHSGTQNAFNSHFYIHPSTRAGLIFAFNTEVSAPAKGQLDTDAIDASLAEHARTKVFPAFARIK
jgi:CubicO group peptidase (beta-lactamase class C family)